MTDECPPEGDLARLLSDRLTADEEAALESHLAGCSICQQHLDLLTSGNKALAPPVEPIPDVKLTPQAGGVLERVAGLLPAQVHALARQSKAGSDKPAALLDPAPAPPPTPSTPPRFATASSTAFRATSRFFRRQFWVWPLVAALVVGGAGWWVNHSVERVLRQQRVNELTTVLDSDIAAIRIWMDSQRDVAELLAGDMSLRGQVKELLAAEAGPEPGRRLTLATAQSVMRTRMEGPVRQGRYFGFRIVSSTGVILAAEHDRAIGVPISGYRKEFLDRVLAGRAAVSKPFLSPILLPNAKGEMRANQPCMFAAAPIRNESGQSIAAVILCIRPDDQFTKLLKVARSGETGETYAFDRDGLILSQSRFDDELKQIGLLVDHPDSQSILTVELRDPGVNMKEWERPTTRRPDQPFTRMAAEATAGRDGHDADGYRDYRGVPVVGAWRWLDEYDFGVATEIDVAEAFQPVAVLRRAFAVLIALLVLGSIGVLLAMFRAARQQRALQLATLDARKLGQYTLVEKLGTGGMGTVYKARHALLRRPTAVKLLNLDAMSETAIIRFEREAQMTSGLTHPNTVAVFDYGRDPSGMFYYAMEYLEGVNLHDLVSQHGPLPEARAVYILRQVCGSLAEAHAAGLVHRDVKPANIVLTSRGGLHDFVKVLDFGLVKTLDDRGSPHLTSPTTVTGTPHYLSPEAVNQPDQVDARSDIYAIGAVAYFLLAGSTVFEGTSVLDICMKHTRDIPIPPSVRSGRVIGRDLEALVLVCLAKNRADRPADAADLLRRLEACTFAGQWTASDAAAWWTAHGPPKAATTTGERSPA